jgi:hypothetical protein
MNAGIYTVAYGMDYDRCAACALRYSRKFTDLPFFVATNLKQRCKAWNEVSGVSFKYFERSQNDNRYAKLNMDLITPFDYTLYFDADSVIQKNGVEVFIPILNEHDMVFNWRITFQPGQKIWNIYAKCMKQFDVIKPISIYNGGLIAFKKTKAVREFFDMWLKMWEQFGRGREMPPLNCAIKKSGINIWTFPLLYFADNARNDSVIIQHNYNDDFNKRFGIVPWSEYKPFDSHGGDDFRFEKEPT